MTFGYGSNNSQRMLTLLSLKMDEWSHHRVGPACLVHPIPHSVVSEKGSEVDVSPLADPAGGLVNAFIH